VFLVGTALHAEPRVIATDAYKREMLRLMIAEANRFASQLKLDEQLPITASNLTLVSLIPAGKTYGTLGVIDTRNYVYSMDVKDFGVVCSGICRKGYQDFLEAQKKYVWPISRYDTNHAFQMAVELLTTAGMDVKALDRDCVVKIDWLGERGLFGRHFFPDYVVTWFPKTKTFHMPPGENVACVEFIEPLKRPRQLQLSGLLPNSKYNLRKPLETVNFMELLTPENSREAVLKEMEMATNYVLRIENLRRLGTPESALREIWRDYSSAPFPTNILSLKNTP
jgi:hypothetical protein